MRTDMSTNDGILNVCLSELDGRMVIRHLRWQWAYAKGNDWLLVISIGCFLGWWVSNGDTHVLRCLFLPVRPDQSFPRQRWRDYPSTDLRAASWSLRVWVHPPWRASCGVGPFCRPRRNGDASTCACWLVGRKAACLPAFLSSVVSFAYLYLTATQRLLPDQRPLSARRPPFLACERLLNHGRSSRRNGGGDSTGKLTGVTVNIEDGKDDDDARKGESIQVALT